MTNTFTIKIGVYNDSGLYSLVTSDAVFFFDKSRYNKYDKNSNYVIY